MKLLHQFFVSIINWFIFSTCKNYILKSFNAFILILYFFFAVKTMRFNLYICSNILDEEWRNERHQLAFWIKIHIKLSDENVNTYRCVMFIYGVTIHTIIRACVYRLQANNIFWSFFFQLCSVFSKEIFISNLYTLI